MKKRPLAIWLIGVALMLSPIYYYFEKSVLAHLPWTEPRLIVAAISLPKLLGIILGPIVGVLVLLVRPISWYAIVGYAVYVTAVNASLLARAHMRAWVFALNLPIAAAVLLYFVRREVMSPYFNPRLRWWESDRVRYRVRAELRTAGAAEHAVGETVDISGTGVYIATDAAIDSGAQVDVRLCFPGSPVDARATVVRVQRDGKRPAGVAMRFDDASATQVRATLNTVAQRTEERVPFELEVDVRGRETIHCKTFDLSALGCFLVTDQRFATGESVSLTLHLVDEAVDAVGTVVWVSDGTRLPRGAGIRFGERSRAIARQLSSMRAG